MHTNFHIMFAIGNTISVMMMMSISPFGHKAVGDLFRRFETYSHQSLYVVKTTYPSVIVNPLR
jgi:hypothetical protein